MKKQARLFWFWFFLAYVLVLGAIKIASGWDWVWERNPQLAEMYHREFCQADAWHYGQSWDGQHVGDCPLKP